MIDCFLFYVVNSVHLAHMHLLLSSLFQQLGLTSCTHPKLHMNHANSEKDKTTLHKSLALKWELATCGRSIGADSHLNNLVTLVTECGKRDCRHIERDTCWLKIVFTFALSGAFIIAYNF